MSEDTIDDLDPTAPPVGVGSEDDYIEDSDPEIPSAYVSDDSDDSDVDLDALGIDPRLFEVPDEDEFEDFDFADSPLGSYAEELEEEWSLDDGFSDSTKTLRVWTDADGVPQRVQLARYWRDRIQKNSLESMCQDVFFQIPFRLPDSVHEVDTSTPLEPTKTSDVINDELLASSEEQLDELLRRVDALEDDEGYGHFEGDSVLGKSKSGHVTVELSALRVPTEASFDPDWIETASPTQVAHALITAWRNALEAYEPPVYYPGERDAITAEIQQVQMHLRQAMNNMVDDIEASFPAIEAHVSTKEQ